MKKRRLNRPLTLLLLATGLILVPIRAHGETQCEKTSDDLLKQGLNEELASIEEDHSVEEDVALDNDILAALKNGHEIAYKDLEATMSDDGTTVEDVVREAVDEADEQDAPKESQQGTNGLSLFDGPGLIPVSRRGQASRADAAADAVRDLIQKTDEARQRRQ